MGECRTLGPVRQTARESQSLTIVVERQEIYRKQFSVKRSYTMTCLTRRKRLCTRICKSAHSTRLSGNKDFGLPQAPNDDICTKMGRIAGFAVEMTLRGIYGGVFTDEFLSVPRSLETRTKRGVSTFHTATTAAAPDLAVKPNPLKSRALSDSCAEPFKRPDEPTFSKRPPQPGAFSGGILGHLGVCSSSRCV